MGRNRLTAEEIPSNRYTSIVILTITGIAQMFTVSFFFVGWFWSISWGIILVSVSSKIFLLFLVIKTLYRRMQKDFPYKTVTILIQICNEN